MSPSWRAKLSKNIHTTGHGSKVIGYVAQRSAVQLRIGSGRAILQQADIVVKHIGVAGRGFYADIGAYAANQQCVNLHTAQHQAKIGVKEGTVAMLDDDRLALQRGEGVNDLRPPTSGKTDFYPTLISIQAFAPSFRVSPCVMKGADKNYR